MTTFPLDRARIVRMLQQIEIGRATPKSYQRIPSCSSPSKNSARNRAETTKNKEQEDK